MDIRVLTEKELPMASRLSGVVFERCIVPFYGHTEMNNVFFDYVNEESLKNMVRTKQLIVWGAFQAKNMIAVGGMQREGHITMLYVLPQFQGRGIGTALLNRMMDYAYDNWHHKKITLNALPAWTVDYFKKWGFKLLNDKQTEIAAFIPMEATLRTRVEYEERNFPDKPAIGLSIFLLVISFLLACGYMILR